MTACSIASHFESPEIRRSGWSCRSGRARFSALTLSALHSYLTTLARDAGRSGRSSLTFRSCRSGRARFSALTLSALHSYLTTLARNPGRSDRPSLTLGSCRSGRARFSALTLNTLHARNAGRSD